MLPRNANLPKKGRTILPFKDMSFRSASLSTPPAFQGLFVVLALVLAVVASIEAATYTVDAPGKLATIATQIQAASGSADKVHHVRFKTYQEVGNFTLTALTADSLIFERDSESAEVIEFSGTLFQMKNVTAAVVFRNLAFKAQNGAAISLEEADSLPGVRYRLAEGFPRNPPGTAEVAITDFFALPGDIAPGSGLFKVKDAGARAGPT